MAIDLQAPAQSTGPGVVWSQSSEDMNLNLMVLGAGAAVAEHVNPAVDVLLVGVRGEGTVSIEGAESTLRPGRIALIARNARRAVAAGPEGLAYLTCHRRRPGLQPRPVQRAAEGSTPRLPRDVER